MAHVYLDLALVLHIAPLNVHDEPVLEEVDDGVVNTILCRGNSVGNKLRSSGGGWVTPWHVASGAAMVTSPDRLSDAAARMTLRLQPTPLVIRRLPCHGWPCAPQHRHSDDLQMRLPQP